MPLDESVLKPIRLPWDEIASPIETLNTTINSVKKNSEKTLKATFAGFGFGDIIVLINPEGFLL